MCNCVYAMCMYACKCVLCAWSRMVCKCSACGCMYVYFMYWFVHVWIIMYICLCGLFVYVGCVLQRCGTRTRLYDPNSVTRDPDSIEFVLVVDPIHWRFKDRSIGWSKDSYWFVQWRPDGDSDTKPRHFMWVFFVYLLSFSVLFHVSVCYYSLL